MAICLIILENFVLEKSVEIIFVENSQPVLSFLETKIVSNLICKSMNAKG